MEENYTKLRLKMGTTSITRMVVQGQLVEPTVCFSDL